MELIFESHATTTDNEAGLASGVFDAPLSAEGRRQARQLGARHNLPFNRVFCSQLRRSFETAALAFPDVTVMRDARLNEIDYGSLTRSAKQSIEQHKHRYIAEPYPGGESYTQAIHRVRDFIDSVMRHAEPGRYLVIGHRATQYGLEHALHGVAIVDAVTAPWCWQPGWTYRVRARVPAEVTG
ncbi:MAG TPA: histidine phosphatase family protein [Polyangiales bacterium]|nr:histidine phosphatase family protein [Polyangiales bacterium]